MNDGELILGLPPWRVPVRDDATPAEDVFAFGEVEQVEKE